MKYELVSRSVTIKGKVFRKSEKVVLEDEKFGKALLESLYKAGFIKPKDTKASNPAEVVNQYKNDLAKEEKAKAKTEEPKVKAKAKTEEAKK